MLFCCLKISLHNNSFIETLDSKVKLNWVLSTGSKYMQHHELLKTAIRLVVIHSFMNYLDYSNTDRFYNFKKH